MQKNNMSEELNMT